jgi:hypothetical protein
LAINRYKRSDWNAPTEDLLLRRADVYLCEQCV